MIQELPSQILENAVQSLASLPGVGRKTALKYALFLLKQDNKTSNQFIDNINNLISNIQYCTKCHNISDKPICEICNNSKRDHHTICVVETIKEVMLIENTAQYDGVYHVLHGAISPMLGIGPNDIKLKELLKRLQQDVDEVIIATNSSLEGETTAMYISKLIKPTGIKVTRIASGVPVGGDLEYIDEVTLLRALEGRTEL